jgi:hypothetical protein
MRAWELGKGTGGRGGGGGVQERVKILQKWQASRLSCQDNYTTSNFIYPSFPFLIIAP